MKRQLHINLFIQSRGHHEASWRHPDASPHALSDIAYYREVAQRAEAGLFDSIFLADTLALMDTAGHAPSNWLEPITALGALAMTTDRIGLIATASTTYSEPFNLARQFGSLDHISGGRVGWNIVTSWLAPAARNFGGTGLVSHDERYERGEEFVQVAKALPDIRPAAPAPPSRALPAGCRACPGWYRRHRPTSLRRAAGAPSPSRSPRRHR